MDELIEKYEKLRKAIYRVEIENRYEGIDEIDEMIFAEEEFNIELFDFLIDIQNNEKEWLYVNNN